MGVVYNVSAIVPTHFYTNLIYLILGFTYYILNVYATYGSFPVNLTMLAVITWKHFFFNCYYLDMTIRRLHTLILVNQKMSQEMKMLLEIFPESVLISRKDSENKRQAWSNQNFRQSFYDIQHNIQKLDKIKVKINDYNNEIDSLYDFIQKQEHKANNEESYKQHDIQIEFTPEPNILDSQDEVESTQK